MSPFVVGKMNSSTSPSLTPDSAAVFACANSLWEACRKKVPRDSWIDLSGAYNGWDQLMREVMRIGTMFETWSCENIDFDNLDEVWPYHLGDNFGEACLSLISVSDLASFGDFDCLRVALRLYLPVKVKEGLPVPVDLIASNPVSHSGFATFRIRTMRLLLGDTEVMPFTVNDDPYDEAFDAPFFGFYGVSHDGLSEHITDRNTLDDVIDLATKLVPGIEFSRSLRPLKRPPID